MFPPLTFLYFFREKEKDIGKVCKHTGKEAVFPLKKFFFENCYNCFEKTKPFAKVRKKLESVRAKQNEKNSIEKTFIISVFIKRKLSIGINMLVKTIKL